MRNSAVAATVIALAVSLLTDLFAPIPGFLHYAVVAIIALVSAPAIYVPYEWLRALLCVVRGEKWQPEFPIALVISTILAVIALALSLLVSGVIVGQLPLGTDLVSTGAVSKLLFMALQSHAIACLVGTVIGMPIDIWRSNRTKPVSPFTIVE